MCTYWLGMLIFLLSGLDLIGKTSWQPCRRINLWCEVKTNDKMIREANLTHVQTDHDIFDNGLLYVLCMFAVSAKLDEILIRYTKF